MIDAWLLFGLIMPFVVFLVEVIWKLMIQVLALAFRGGGRQQGLLLFPVSQNSVLLGFFSRFWVTYNSDWNHFWGRWRTPLKKNPPKNCLLPKKISSLAFSTLALYWDSPFRVPPAHYSKRHLASANKLSPSHYLTFLPIYQLFVDYCRLIGG